MPKIRKVAQGKYPLFPAFCVQSGLPKPEPEVAFHPTRKHRMDFAWRDQKLAVEVEGGVWTFGRHGRGSGIVKDMEKASLAAEEGWRVIRVTPKALHTQETVASIQRALRWRITATENE